jgi:hypothetical protein
MSLSGLLPCTGAQYILSECTVSCVADGLFRVFSAAVAVTQESSSRHQEIIKIQISTSSTYTCT